MKMKTRQITVTAIMLAICIASQFFKNLSVYITGPIINAALILTVLYAGLACGIILSIITPVTAFFITGSPVMAAIPAMFPCIMAGNVILVLCVALFKGKLGSKAGFPVSIVIGSILKGLFMGVVISLIILPKISSYYKNTIRKTIDSVQSTSVSKYEKFISPSFFAAFQATNPACLMKSFLMLLQ